MQKINGDIRTFTKLLRPRQIPVHPLMVELLLAVTMVVGLYVISLVTVVITPRLMIWSGRDYRPLDDQIPVNCAAEAGVRSTESLFPHSSMLGRQRKDP